MRSSKATLPAEFFSRLSLMRWTSIEALDLVQGFVDRLERRDRGHLVLLGAEVGLRAPRARPRGWGRARAPRGRPRPRSAGLSRCFCRTCAEREFQLGRGERIVGAQGELRVRGSSASSSHFSVAW